MSPLVRFAFVVVVCVLPVFSQITGSDMLGLVQDPSGGVVPEAKVTLRNLGTNDTRQVTTGVDGRFRFPQLPVGSYELAVEKPGFSRYVQGPIVLRLNEDAELKVHMQLAGVTEVVNVSIDAPLINTTTAEIGVNFDRRRVSELPLVPNRNVTNLALSVAGVSQIATGNTTAGSGATGAGSFNGTTFSVNGARLRSNNFIIDGQDANFTSTTGLVQPMNNPDLVEEFRLITSQFAPEHGRTAGSVVSIVTKTGTNKFHGSAFWFHNDQHLNSRNNLEERIFRTTPFRIENQFGGTVGGPVLKNRTFFFGSLQRWTERRLGAGAEIRGVPTEEGRNLLTQVAGTRPTVRALLEHMPAAQTPIAGLSAPLTAGGRTVQIPLGSITGSAAGKFDDWQGSARIDHRFSDKHTLGGRYLIDDRVDAGTGQVTPAGLTNIGPQRSQAGTLYWSSSFSPRSFNELRTSYQRFKTETQPETTKSLEIPSIQISELGMTGFNAIATRTAIGYGVNLPQYTYTNTYQIQETFGLLRGTHSMKFGIDFRRQEQWLFFVPTIRGNMAYSTLQDFVDDVSLTASINAKLSGGGSILSFRWYDYFWFAQDEWRIKPNLTLTYGIRYESPGETIKELLKINRNVVSAFGGDQRFALTPVPPRDTNNWSPRLGFNYQFGEGPGALKWLTGERKLVLRGGYSRSYDYGFINIASNVGTAFPFFNTVTLPARSQRAFETIQRIRDEGAPADPRTATRTIVGSDFRSPYMEQFAMQLQRQLAPDWALSVGWVATKGTALFQTVDGNPTVPGSGGRQRVDPNFGVVRLRCNCTASVYHSLQTSLQKRLSSSFSMGAHYTWSAFIDGASELFNPSGASEVAIAQDSFNRRADRARSTFDRPHRFTTNAVFELPVQREQKGALGKVLGGWQVSPFITFQAGAPFTVANGSDPFARVTGIDGLVGNSIRPNLNTNLDLSSMKLEEILAAGGTRLFSLVTAASGAQLGNAGRNILRGDGILNLDVGFIKNTRVSETNILQFRAEFFNLTNTRNFGIPGAQANSPASFLNQWGTDGGKRVVLLGLRYTF